MLNKDDNILQYEYSKEGIVQQLALIKIQSEINNLKTYEIGEKFKKYCDEIRAHL